MNEYRYISKISILPLDGSEHETNIENIGNMSLYLMRSLFQSWTINEYLIIWFSKTDSITLIESRNIIIWTKKQNGSIKIQNFVQVYRNANNSWHFKDI